jgi:hypothetical protein
VPYFLRRRVQHLWGTWTALDPQWLFRFARMPAANDPQVFACLGMVIGLYGVLYLEVARRPEHGWRHRRRWIDWGKILGPIGLAIELVRGKLGARGGDDLRYQRSHLVDSICMLPA